MIYGYCRISRAKQSIERQIRNIKAVFPDAVIIQEVFTRTRLDRMVMCAFLGISQENLATPAPYARALAFNDTGRAILSAAKKTGLFPNAGEFMDHPYQTLETRYGALYGLFAEETPEAPDVERLRRVKYEKSAEHRMHNAE